MSTAEDLLASLSETAHTHTVNDQDTYFVIDPISRQIENTARKKNTIMQFDHRSEIFTFELPRYVEGHDMSLCDRVRVHYNNVGTKTGAEEEEIEERADVVELTDLRINPENTETVICSWTIERQSTQLVGILSFLVHYLCTDNGEVVYEWHTDIYSDIEIRKGRNNGEAAVIEYSNILEQWYTRIFGAGDSVMASIASESADQIAAIQTESAKQQSAIESKGAETLATIPEDYTATYNMANDATRMKAGAIVLSSEGEMITVHDSSDDYVRGLNLYGKSTQFTTTGVNLLPSEAVSTESLGVSFIVNEDKSVYAKGTAENTVYLTLRGGYAVTEAAIPDWLVPGKTYTLSDAGLYLYAADGNSQTSFTNQTFVMPSGYDYYGMFIRIGVGESVDKIYYPMLNEGSIALPWEPYTGNMASPNPEYPQEIESIGNGGIIGVNVHGSNLLDYETWKQSGATYATATFVDNGVVLTTAEDRGDGFTNYTNKFSKVPCVPGVKYILSWEHSGANGMVYIFPNGEVDDMISIWTNEANQLEYIPSDGVEYFTFRVGVSAPGVTGTYKNVRINVSEKQSFELYREPQTITIPRALPGIPVTSGGNYTDSDGQQWICDEVDFERGVYIQRTKLIDLTECKTWSTWGVSAYAEGVTGFYHYPNNTFVAYDVLCTISKCEQMVWGGKIVGAAAAADYIMIAVENERLADISSANAAINSFNEFIASVGGQILVAIAPIETPLTAEELETFKALHTNYPNTTVLNDQSAYMKVSYNADTKTYVDNKIAEAVAQYLATA